MTIFKKNTTNCSGKEGRRELRFTCHHVEDRSALKKLSAPRHILMVLVIMAPEWKLVRDPWIRTAPCCADQISPANQ